MPQIRQGGDFRGLFLDYTCPICKEPITWHPVPPEKKGPRYKAWCEICDHAFELTACCGQVTGDWKCKMPPRK